MPDSIQSWTRESSSIVRAVLYCRYEGKVGSLKAPVFFEYGTVISGRSKRTHIQVSKATRCYLGNDGIVIYVHYSVLYLIITTPFRLGMYNMQFEMKPVQCEPAPPPSSVRPPGPSCKRHNESMNAINSHNALVFLPSCSRILHRASLTTAAAAPVVFCDLSLQVPKGDRC
jgi:hypothetical protein